MPMKTLLQAVGVVCGAFILSMIVHKGYVDVYALAQQHSGEKFWLALGRYFLRNLAGGGPPE
jgi:hypothetical protein